MASGLINAIIGKPFAAGKLIAGIAAAAGHKRDPGLMEHSV
jgi:hypothetical protein